MDMDKKCYGALKRLIKELKEYRKADCLIKDCLVNREIGGNDINLVEGWVNRQQKVIDKIDKEIKEYMKPWLNWFSSVSDDIDAKEPEDLLRIDAYSEYDQFYYSQGFIRGLQEAQRIIENA